jgi:hypothetical protein
MKWLFIGEAILLVVLPFITGNKNPSSITPFVAALALAWVSGLMFGVEVIKHDPRK